MRGTSIPLLGLALVLTVIWMAAPVLGQPAAPALPGPRTIVAGQSLAGISIGMTITGVVQRFGTPSAVVETDRDVVYVWGRFGINVYARDGAVTAVSTSNSLLRVGNALGPGFRIDDVHRVFGQAYEPSTVEGFPGVRFDALGIAFGLDRRAVAVVLIFVPGQAAQVSGLQRGARLAAPRPSGPPVISGIPFVAGQRPYSMMTNYMSLAGYLRWVVYQSSANWITLAEAGRIVGEQQAASVRPGE